MKKWIDKGIEKSGLARKQGIERESNAYVR